MTFTSDQIQAVRHGEPVEIVPPEIGEECVVIRKDIYRRVELLLRDIAAEQAYPAIDEAWREGWDDPKMADYDRYDQHRR